MTKQKSVIILSSLLTIVGLCLGLSSCKEDEPPAKPIVTVESETRTISEGVGTVTVEIELDKPATEDLTIEYSLSGTAVDFETVGSEALADYAIADGSGEVEIEAGSSEGLIEFTIYDDAAFEESETIIIELEDAGEKAVIGELSLMEITISNNDDKVKASFTNTTLNVTEGDGIVEIQIPLDKAATQSSTIQYTLGGNTAVDSITGTSSTPRIPADYAIVGQSGTVSVNKDATVAKIRARIYSDFYFDPEESFTITLTGGSGIDLGANTTLTVNILQENGTIAELYWDESYTDVDMDMFLWLGNATNPLELWAASTFASPEPPEQIFIPDSFNDGTLGGMSYVYWGGSADPMEFSVLFADFIDGEVEPEANFQIFEGSYTAANKNAWVNLDDITEIEQTFEIQGGTFVNFSAIQTPASGSRIRTKRTLGNNFLETQRSKTSRIRKIIH
jgi:hypothetical protein